MQFEPKQFFDNKSGVLKSIPLEYLNSREEILKVLGALLKYANIRYHKLPLRILQLAYESNCLTQDDITFILNKPIQACQIFEITVGSIESFDPAGETQDPYAAHYIDMLLFVAELHNPKVDRLRGERRKFDIVQMMGVKGKPSPSQTVATMAWEKILRSQYFSESKCYKCAKASECKPEINNKPCNTFENRSNSLAQRVRCYDISYWAFSMATKCKDSGAWFLAFDHDFNLLVDHSINIMKEINVRLSFFAPIKEGDHKRHWLRQFCIDHVVEFVGTPFYPLETELSSDTGLPPAQPLHFLPQQISIAWLNNSLQINVPTFYKNTHIHSLWEEDFKDVQMALSGNMVFKSKRTAIQPSDDDPPLTEKEAAEVIKLLRLAYDKVINEFICTVKSKKTDKMIPALDSSKFRFWTVHQDKNIPLSDDAMSLSEMKSCAIFHCVSMVISKWWKSPPCEYNSTLRAYFRPPKSLGGCRISVNIDKKVLLEKAINYIANSTISAVSPKQRYIFDRFVREARKR